MKDTDRPLSHLTWVLGLEPRKFGGIERLCVGIARGASARGVRADFVFECAPTPVVAAALEEHSASWHVVPRVGDLRARASIALAWHLWKSKPDAVHLHFCEFYVPFFLIARSLGIRLIGTYHVSGTPARPTRIRQIWKRFRHRLFEGSLTAITAVSASARRKFVSDYWENPNRVAIVHNGIGPTSRIMRTESARALAEQRRSPRMIFVGALIREKGAHIAVNALAKTRQSHSDTTLTIVGEGPERSNLEQLAATLGVAESVSFLGLRDDVPELFCEHDIAVVPSIWHEAFGYVILEAMAASCPVIASDVGGIPEIIRNGEDGLLVVADDAEVLAQAVVRLWNAPDLRARLVAFALTRVDSVFSIDHVVGEYWKVYDRAFAGSKPNSVNSASGHSRQQPDKGAQMRKGHDAQRPVLLLAYHFHPSNAIASRRCTAFARHLVSERRPTIVVSAFEGLADSSSQLDLNGLTSVPVAPAERGAILGLLIRLNRSLRKSPDRPSSEPASHSAHQQRWLARSFWSLVQIVDRHKRWSWRAAAAGVQAAREHDAQMVIVSGPPWSSVVAGLWVATRCKLPLVVDFRDPWFDFFLSETQRVPPLRAIEEWLETMVLDRAAAVVCTAPALAERLVARHPGVAAKIHVVMNGFDGPVHSRPASTDHRLSILFAGELYLNRDPFPFLRALEQLLARADIDASRINVTFVGECAVHRGQRLDNWLKGKRAAAVVQILPLMPANEVTQMIATSSLLLNFAQRTPLAIPAKTFEHMASGREVLAFCDRDGDTARVVAGVSGVTCIHTDDVDAIAEVLAGIYHRHVVLNTLTAPDPRQITCFSRRYQNDRFTEVLDSVCDGPMLAASPQN